MAEVLQDINIEEIYLDNEFNCRGPISPVDVSDLMNSITQSGLLQPIMVQPYSGKADKKYRVLMGHRRFTAFTFLAVKDNKFSKIPAIIRDNLSEADATFLNFAENLNRRALDIKQEADTVDKLRKLGYTLQEIAKELGKSFGWVQVRSDLLSLPQDIQLEAKAGIFKQDDIKDLAQINRHCKPEELYNAARKLKEAQGKVKIKIKDTPEAKKVKKTAGKIRSEGEITYLKEKLLKDIGPNPISRVLAWAYNYISNAAIAEDLIKEYGIEFEQTFTNEP